MVKKVLIGLGIFLVVVIVTLAAAPIIFKEEINRTIDEQLEANVNAEVIYDIEDFSLSFFANFPNLTASISELSVVGREPFAGQVLFDVNGFSIELNIWKLLGSEMTVQGIYLDQPKIFIKVLEDGRANYDIAISSEEEADTIDTESSDFRFAIDHWRLSGGHIIYDDATIPTYLELTDFDHQGSGNFSLSVFDLSTATQAYVRKLSYDNQNYLEQRNLNLDLIINMDLDQMKFTFKENNLAINDFAFGFDGWLAMPADDIDMDLTFASQENSFKSLLSLIPAIYTNDFDQLESSGSLAFNGAIKGTYNEVAMPAYDINLMVREGMFHYPDLPESVNNVKVDMNIASKDGNIDNTAIDISTFHLEFGQEPMHGYLKLGNLVSYPIDLEFNTSIDLANLSHLLPMEGLELSGIIEARIKAAGEYDSLKSTIPLIDASINYRNGSIRYADVPAPIDEINMSASLKNTTGNLNDTKFAIPEFAMDLDGSPISGTLLIEEFDNIHWQTALTGDLNFDKLFPIINHLYPLPGTTLKGVIKTRMSSEGTMQNIENENYSALKTTGEAIFENFVYTDSLYLPQGITLSTGKFSFDPREIKVMNLMAATGSSDFTFNGNLTNYINYLFNNELLMGQLKMTSKSVDVNEFMTATTTEESPAEEVEYSIVEIPNNISFVFDASINEIKYDNLLLENAQGRIIVSDGELRLEDLSTETLDGAVRFNGLYSTADLNMPKFDMELDVKGVQIDEAYEAFSVVRVMAPIASNVTGEASSLFSMRGDLKSDMMPDMATLNGQGKIFIADASLEDSKFVSGLASFLKGGEKQSLTLQDITMNVEIVNGQLKVEPFDLRLNNTRANIGGKTGLDGSIDYAVKMEVPAGKVGAQVNALIGSISGKENSSETINLNIGVGGTYDNPRFKLLGTDGQESISQSVTQAASELVKENVGLDVPASKEELNEAALEKAREEADNLLREAQKQADQIKQEAKKNADRLREEAKKQNDKLIKDAGSNVFQKKGAEIAGKKIIDEANIQAQKIEDEGNKQAEAIMTKARERADAIIKKAEE